MDISVFLSARWDEIEADAPNIHEANYCDFVRPDPDGCGPSGPCDCRWPALIAADIALKRGILAWHTHVRFATHPDEGSPFPDDARQAFPGDPMPYVGCRTCAWDYRFEEVVAAWWCDYVLALAAPFASHPDFDPAWVVET